MNSLAVLESWIAHKLLTSTVITTNVGDRVWLGESEEVNGGFFVLYSHVSAVPLYTLGTKRNLSNCFYDIVAWKSGRDAVELKTVANEIDNLFCEIRAEEYQGYEFSSHTHRELSFVDQSDLSVTWRRLGGTYRIVANQI